MSLKQQPRPTSYFNPPAPIPPARLGMDNIHTLLDVPSPSGSYPYIYRDADRYFDTHTSTSPEQSLANSPYEMAYPGDFPPYPSPAREDGSQSPQAQEAQQEPSKPAAKRKRENRYKNAPPSVLSRRRAQNRASQRAYRERKDQRIKDLEQMLSDARQRNDILGQAYAELHAEYTKLKAGQLRDAAASSSYPADLASFDPAAAAASMGLSNDRLDMDLYVYPDSMTGYSL